MLIFKTRHKFARDAEIAQYSPILMSLIDSYTFFEAFLSLKKKKKKKYTITRLSNYSVKSTSANHIDTFSICLFIFKHLHYYVAMLILPSPDIEPITLIFTSLSANNVTEMLIISVHSSHSHTGLHIPSQISTCPQATFNTCWHTFSFFPANHMLFFKAVLVRNLENPTRAPHVRKTGMGRHCSSV